jgi:hypothetical protein
MQRFSQAFFAAKEQREYLKDGTLYRSKLVEFMHVREVLGSYGKSGPQHKRDCGGGDTAAY